MAAVAIDFNRSVDNRNMGKWVRVIGDINHTGIASRMATGILAAAGHSSMVKARSAGESGGGVARTAILIRLDMRW